MYGVLNVNYKYVQRCNRPEETINGIDPLYISRFDRRAALPARVGSSTLGISIPSVYPIVLAHYLEPPRVDVKELQRTEYYRSHLDGVTEVGGQWACLRPSLPCSSLTRTLFVTLRLLARETTDYSACKSISHGMNLGKLLSVPKWHLESQGKGPYAVASVGTEGG